MIKLDNDWDSFLAIETAKPYYQELRKFLASEYRSQIVYPNMHDIFNALKYTSYENTKIVILGQDPYINEGEAHGLAFSVKPEAKIPPSLKNIFIELQNDINCDIPTHGHLIKWASQGVMLLNSVLTVRARSSKSHANKGWEEFTGAVIQKLNEKPKTVVYLLWGNDAKAKVPLITNPNHRILMAAHPSPLAGGKFFNCKHFSKVNTYLTQNNLTPIDWQIK